MSEPVIPLPLSTAEKMVSLLGSALDQAFGGGGLTMLTALQVQINAAKAAEDEAAKAAPEQ